MWYDMWDFLEEELCLLLVSFQFCHQYGGLDLPVNNMVKHSAVSLDFVVIKVCTKKYIGNHLTVNS